MGYSVYLWNGVHLKRGCENLTSVVRWIHWSFHWSFLHWKKWIWFSPWWWAQPWWLTSYLHVSCFARFIGDDETQQRYTFRLLWVLWLHGEHREDLNLYSDMENQTIFHMFCFSFAGRMIAESSQKCTKESWEDRRIHFCDFGRRNFVWHWLEKSSVFCLSMMIARATFWKAFRTGVANRSEGDIMNHVLVLEMFQRFSNTQTYLNKQTMSWCKDFLWGHVFLIAFVRVSRKMLTGDSASFCVKAWHTNKNHSDMSRDISLLLVCVW